MNFFEHHIGDYDSATAHLSAVEDGIYGRLLRLYYRTEHPPPADVAQCCRLVRANTPAERAAVRSVLAEFFELREDGWHQHRCDEEIERFHDAQPDRDRKRENAAERQRRARDRRRVLFDALRSLGEVPPFDTPNRSLEAMLARAKSRATARPESREPVTPSHEPVTRDITATTSHFPLPNETPTVASEDIAGARVTAPPPPHGRSGIDGDAEPPAPPPPPPPPPPTAASPPPTRAGLLCWRLRAAGIVDVNPGHPRLLALLDAGATDAEFLGFAPSATRAGQPFAYLLGQVEGERRRAAEMAAGLARGPLPSRPEVTGGGMRSASDLIAEMRADAAQATKPPAELLARVRAKRAAAADDEASRQDGAVDQP